MRESARRKAKMGFLEKLSPEQIAQWMQLLIVALGVVLALRKMWREEVQNEKMSRLDFIKASVPEIHGLVQKIAAATKTQKDDEFVRQIDVLLRAVGMLPVQPAEVGAVKALGSGYHQEVKSVRIPEGLLPVDPQPAPEK
jgi:hypothetical protein